ncbi:MAG: acetyl-CoA carboxylase biotin carboxylase subunit [Myxococcota bacterium]
MDKPSTINRILVANRGEIACRIIRSAHSLGRTAVAVYSEADKDAPHVRMADEAVCIGPPSVAASYLNIDAIIAAAQKTNADAIHPGYGFLAENADFARAATAAGLVFIGPPIEAIALMGNKAAAKRRMLDAAVPCVLGYQGTDQTDPTFVKQARDIGYPVMVKAAAGGGGRGMRLVEDESQLVAALARARAEADSAFGSDELILEKAVVRPRHVEIQVFADRHGHVIHLGERDCSVQRRHQKVIEEAPCPVMTPQLRSAMGQAAVEAAKSIDYVGAGTVEFLLDASGAFYFLEMNTRLQVEHPVTEMVTGIDLVAQQISVAEGHPLDIEQSDVAFNGHAIEVRLYAEDPAQGFTPSTGCLERWSTPDLEGIRVDDGVDSGTEISPYYDPMVAKVIGWGPTRETARLRLVSALKQTAIFGPKNNRDFLIEALQAPSFINGEATTAFIAETFGDAPAPSSEDRLPIAAAVLTYALQAEQAKNQSLGLAPSLMGWSSAGALISRYIYSGESEQQIAVQAAENATYKVTTDDKSWTVQVVRRDEHFARLKIDDALVDALYHAVNRSTLYVSIDGRMGLFSDDSATSAADRSESGEGRIVAPMHGLLAAVDISPGGVVKKGQRILVLEAMKMQHEILADIDGTVKGIYAEAGQQVSADTLLAEIEVAKT